VATVQPALGSGRIAALLPPVFVAAAAAAAVGVVAAVDPNEPGHYPTCPFLALTGQFCPGCGSLRAVHALAHGDLGTAVGLNVLAVLAVVPLLLIWLQWLRRSWTGGCRRTVAPAPAPWALVVVVCVFAVVRNLPPGAALAP
jgi:hypothetical protein